MQGGEPDMSTVSKMVLNDWQRGRIPFFVKPPGSETDEEVRLRLLLYRILASFLTVLSDQGRKTQAENTTKYTSSIHKSVSGSLESQV